MRVSTLFVICFVLGGPSLSAANESNPAERPQPYEVPCMCQSDLHRALQAQREIPDYAKDQHDGRPLSVESRLYRDGYRPVRNGIHVYWCRVSPTTGSRMSNNVQCELDLIIEGQYRASHL